MNQITVNGRTISVPSGCSLSVINNVVYVDGQRWEGDPLEGTHHTFDVQGTLLSLKVDQGDVTVHGSVQGNVDSGGSVTCGNVDGFVSAGGSFRGGHVNGNVSAGGSVTCEDIAGNVSAGGSIRRK